MSDFRTLAGGWKLSPARTLTIAANEIIVISGANARRWALFVWSAVPALTVGPWPDRPAGLNAPGFAVTPAAGTPFTYRDFGGIVQMAWSAYNFGFGGGDVFVSELTYEG